MKKLILSTALLFLPLLASAETQQWEYATFEDRYAYGGWFESESLLCQSTSKQELVTCLGATIPPDYKFIPRFYILNAIGKLGWELTTTMATGSTPNNVLFFKRLKPATTDVKPTSQS